MPGKIKLTILGILLWFISETAITVLVKSDAYLAGILWAILSVSASVAFAVKLQRPSEVRWGLILALAGLVFPHVIGVAVATYIMWANYRRQKSKLPTTGQTGIISEEERVSRPQSLYEGVRVRYLMGWMILSLVISLMAAYNIVVFRFKSEDWLIIANITAMAHSSLLLLWVLDKMEKYHLGLWELVAPLPRGHRWISQILVLIGGTVLFSVGTGILILYAESFFFPVHVQETLAYHPLRSTAGATAHLHRIVWGIIVVILAPITEELVFRGIILRRLAVKWPIKYAIIGSSLLFGIVHGEEGVLGAFAAGMILAVLYLKTRTLIVPIFMHMLNNAFGYGMAWVSLADQQAYTLEQLRGDVWAGAVFMLVSLPGIIYYLRKAWPTPETGDGLRHEVALRAPWR